MDTTYHSNIPIETLSLLDCDVRNFDFIHPIKNIFFDNIEYIRKLDASGKARPCILDNVSMRAVKTKRNGFGYKLFGIFNTTGITEC